MPKSRLPSERLTLADLTLGQPALIAKLDFDKQERWRLEDLGFLPGTCIVPELSSPSTDPIAYRVRGAMVALRSEQAEKIYVELKQT